MNIQFSQDLIRGFSIYLEITLGEIAKDEDFPYSKPLLYKVADGSIPVSQQLNEAFNKYWNDRELTADDLSNIYQLIDLIEAGRKKQKEYEVKKYKGGK